MAFDESDIAGFEVSVADSEEDARAAATLVHDSYVGRGIMAPHPSGMRVTPHLVLPSSRTFVAKRAGKVVGTVSLLADSPLRLPMDSVYGPELARFRDAGRKLAEVGALAICRELRGTGLVFLLNRIMLHCAMQLGVDRLVIAVHPKALDLYVATLSFEQFGPVRPFPGLSKSALAVALDLDLTTAENRWQRDFGRLGASNRNPHHLYCVRECPQISLRGALDPSARERRLAASGALVRASRDVFRTLPAAQTSYLRSVLPNVLWPSQSRPDLSEAGSWAHLPGAAAALVEEAATR